MLRQVPIHSILRNPKVIYKVLQAKSPWCVASGFLGKCASVNLIEQNQVIWILSPTYRDKITQTPDFKHHRKL